MLCVCCSVTIDWPFWKKKLWNWEEKKHPNVCVRVCVGRTSANYVINKMWHSLFSGENEKQRGKFFDLNDKNQFNYVEHIYFWLSIVLIFFWIQLFCALLRIGLRHTIQTVLQSCTHTYGRHLKFSFDHFEIF